MWLYKKSSKKRASGPPLESLFPASLLLLLPHVISPPHTFSTPFTVNYLPFPCTLFTAMPSCPQFLLLGISFSTWCLWQLHSCSTLYKYALRSTVYQALCYVLEVLQRRPLTKALPLGISPCWERRNNKQVIKSTRYWDLIKAQLTWLPQADLIVSSCGSSDGFSSWGSQILTLAQLLQEASMNEASQLKLIGKGLGWRGRGVLPVTNWEYMSYLKGTVTFHLSIIATSIISKTRGR